MMDIELTGQTKYYSVKKEGKEYTAIMMVDTNSQSAEWEIFTIDETETEKSVDEETRNKIIEAVIGFEENKSLGE